MTRPAAIVIGLFVLFVGGLSLWHTWWLSAGEGAFCGDLAAGRVESGGTSTELIQRLDPYVRHRHLWLNGLGATQMVAGLALVGFAAWRRRPAA